MSSKVPRYQGRPLLRVAECLVLRAIGHLPPQNARALEDMTPSFQKLWGIEAEWPEIARRVLLLEPDFEERMRRSWANLLDQFPELPPQAFAENVADLLFSEAPPP